MARHGFDYYFRPEMKEAWAEYYRTGKWNVRKKFRAYFDATGQWHDCDILKRDWTTGVVSVQIDHPDYPESAAKLTIAVPSHRVKDMNGNNPFKSY